MRQSVRWSGSGSPGAAARAGRIGVGLDLPSGFTLLELLVVLVLVGLVTTLAFPNLARLQGAVTKRTERDYILDQLAGVGRQAMLQGRAYVIFGSGGEQESGLPGTDWAAADAKAGTPRTAPAGDDSGSITHSGHERFPIDLPDEWEIRLDEPLVVNANGVCLGAEFTLYHRRVEDARIRLEPPFCRIEPDA